MLLQMQTQHSKMSFDLDPDAVGELIQAAFRYSSNMAQLQPGWSEAIAYQDGQRDWDGQETMDMPEEENTGWYIPDLEEDGAQADMSDQTEPGDGQNGNQEDMSEPGRDQEPGQHLDEGSLTEDETQNAQVTDNGWEQDGSCRQTSADEGADADPDAGADTAAWPEDQPEGQRAPSVQWPAQRQDKPYPRMMAPSELGKYKGFLLIKCEQCGKLKGFCSKFPISWSKCECGWKTTLNGMHGALADCECGKRWVYQTNADDDIIEVNCIECGSPIDMSYNPKQRMYFTIKDKRG